MSTRPGAAARERTHRIVDLIRRKRDGGELAADEIQYIVSRYTEGAIPDYQVSALLMAIVLKQMTRAELAALTEAMLHSGSVLDFSDIPGQKVDKHSTGGVGDKTSLVIAPVVAAAGVPVPMISGRGLGHTGGTLDKLESIPGFNVSLSLDQFRRVLSTCGCGLIGQTAEIAPADKKLYALRDVTGTVESPYLICASIMSKKLAEGIDGLVLDVKTGSGAFMKKFEDSVFLAELMVETGKRMGKKTVALITDMDQPLGRAVGNSIEVAECISVLKGGTAGADDMRDLSLELSAWMFVLAGRSKSVESGRALAEEMVRSGGAAEKFRQIIELQGGDPKVIDDPGRLPRSKQSVEVLAPSAGYISRMMCEQIGTACVVLGGGREKKEDSVDPSVGLVVQKKSGDAVEGGEPVFTVHYNSDARLQEAMKLLESSFTVAERPPAEKRPLVHKVIS